MAIKRKILWRINLPKNRFKLITKKKKRRRRRRVQLAGSIQCPKLSEPAMNLASSSRRRATTSSNKVTTQKLSKNTPRSEPSYAL